MFPNEINGLRHFRGGVIVRPDFTRLVTVKTKYDPTNFFRLNANVKPKSA